MAEATRLGSYEILRRIARGGMAELYLARSVGPEGFEKLLVLKKILPHFADNPKFVKLFLDEAKLAAGLDHPHIAHVYDMGVVDGNYFFTMEYVHGQDMRSALRRQQDSLSANPAAAADNQNYMTAQLFFRKGQAELVVLQGPIFKVTDSLEANGSVAAGSCNDVGILSLKPAVNNTDATSPMALPNDNNMAVNIPGLICRKTTLATSQRVAPKESVASRNSPGTVRITSSSVRTRIGITSSVTAIIPPNKEARIPK